MLIKEKIENLILSALDEIFSIDKGRHIRPKVDYPPKPELGDYTSNIAFVRLREGGSASHERVGNYNLVGSNAKSFGSPIELAQEIKAKIDDKKPDYIYEIKVVNGFLNFKIKPEYLYTSSFVPAKQKNSEKILLEYFQPNIAKPLHIGHVRTAIIGDCLKRMLLHAGLKVESDTHMGDWGTQFGFLILGCKQLKNSSPSEDELNKIYVELNNKAESDPSIREAAKQEFVKLETGDDENRKIWKSLVDVSVQKFLKFAKDFDLLPFEHHLSESFYEDKMPEVIEKLKQKGLLKESQGAQIVNLEDQGLAVAIIIKSDGGTTYLLRDLATFIYARDQGFEKHLYVVDSRQSLHYRQLFAILKLMGEMKDEEGVHIDYGFMSFKGTVLSTRKGNMLLAEDVLAEAEERVSKIIAEKNPDLANKKDVSKAVAIAAIKYFDLSHNRHSDIEFDWEEALDFEGNTGPYLQYAYARLASILRKEPAARGNPDMPEISETERQLLFKLSIFDEVIAESLKDYLPNIFANYLYELAALANRFYHESPVIKETDSKKKEFRLNLVSKTKNTLSRGLELLGIKALEEM